MIGPLHLGQVTTHIGYSLLCLCCCEKVEEKPSESGGSNFQNVPVTSPQGVNPFVTQVPSPEVSSQNPLPLDFAQSEFRDRVNKYRNSDIIAPRRSRRDVNSALDYKLKKSAGLMRKREEDEFIMLMIAADEESCCEC